MLGARGGESGVPVHGEFRLSGYRLKRQQDQRLTGLHAKISANASVSYEEIAQQAKSGQTLFYQVRPPLALLSTRGY